MTVIPGSQQFVFRWLLQPYWRMTRGLTIGAQGVVIDKRGHVLLVRHGYRPGWRFPGGGVELGESVETALGRELDEETGVILGARPELFGVYSNHAVFKGDHVTLFVVRDWTRQRIPTPNHEIIAQDFFDPLSPPPDCAPSTLRRLAEVFGGAPRDQIW